MTRRGKRRVILYLLGAGFHTSLVQISNWLRAFHLAQYCSTNFKSSLTALGLRYAFSPHRQVRDSVILL